MCSRISELAEEVGETTLFAIEESGEALVLYRGECTSSVLVANNIPGRRIPMHATASGKTLLAYSPHLLPRLATTLAAYTPKTTITREAVHRQLRIVRRRGFATCWEEHEIALNSIAVPVFGVAGVLAGALTIAGPSGRLNQRTYRQYLTPLTETVRRIHEHFELPAAGQT
jgi:DNA-binding IclR family transcriptional regulator